jgi:hypothetical protein
MSLISWSLLLGVDGRCWVEAENAARMGWMMDCACCRRMVGDELLRIWRSTWDASLAVAGKDRMDLASWMGAISGNPSCEQDGTHRG